LEVGDVLGSVDTSYDRIECDVLLSQTLTRDEIQLFVWRYEDNESQVSIAKRLGVSQTTVSSKLRFIRKKMLDALRLVV
jgi:RNA polymerase sigma factor (sigma-70 family)